MTIFVHIYSQPQGINPMEGQDPDWCWVSHSYFQKRVLLDYSTQQSQIITVHQMWKKRQCTYQTGIKT